jgi:hypothetical protein
MAWCLIKHQGKLCLLFFHTIPRYVSSKSKVIDLHGGLYLWIVVFWVMTSCSLVGGTYPSVFWVEIFYREAVFFRNDGNHLKDNAAS